MSKDAYQKKLVSTIVGIIVNYFSQTLAEVATSTVNAINAVRAKDNKSGAKISRAVEAYDDLFKMDIWDLVAELKGALDEVFNQVTEAPEFMLIDKYLDDLEKRLKEHGLDVNIQYGDSAMLYALLDAVFLGEFNESKLQKIAEQKPTSNGEPRPMSAVIMDELLAKILPTPEFIVADSQDSQSKIEEFLKGKGVKFA